MDLYNQRLYFSLLSFAVICLSAVQVGRGFSTLKLPTITGYLFLGIIAGPQVLSLISGDALHSLKFIDEIALGFIAFCAGSELFWRDVRPRLRSIAFLTICIMFITFSLCSVVFFFLGDYIDFMKDFDHAGKIAAAILAGAILVARSPSSAIAIVKELKAKGPFTQIALGVTVVMDIGVIVLFTLNQSIAQTLLTGSSLGVSFLGGLLVDLALSIILGLIVAQGLIFVISSRAYSAVKSIIVLSVGYGCFVLSHQLATHTSIHLEGMLACLVCGFYMGNFFSERREFIRILNQASPLIYVAFFTLTGASLTLDILEKVWPVTLCLFAVRLIAIIIGSQIGERISANPEPQYKIRWMCFITQAGVGLGLAKQVGDQFLPWGPEFATIIISVIIINEILGPVFFKWALFLAGEAKSRAKKSEKQTIPNAIIFGERNDAQALSRQLCAHNWEVRLVHNSRLEVNFTHEHFSSLAVDSIEKSSFVEVKANDSDTFVAMLNDEENLLVANYVRDNFPDSHLIIQLDQRENMKLFDDFPASLVDPTTAMISLLDHYVRTPSAVSLLLGYEKDQDIVDCIVKNQYLRGKKLYELNLPSDLLILEIRRAGKHIDFHSGFRLEMNDQLTLIGHVTSLEQATYKLAQT